MDNICRIVIALFLAFSARGLAASPPSTAPIAPAEPFAPTLVTLRLDKIPARESLYRLSKQSGISFNPMPQMLWNGGGGGEITLTCDNEPFWSCLQKLCAQAKLHVVASTPGGAVQLAINDPKSVPSPYAVAGPYLFKVGLIDHARRLAFDAAENRQVPPTFRISVTVLGEPKMKPATWSIDKIKTLIIDNTPHPAPDRLYRGGGRVPDTLAGDITFPLDGAASRINLLSGDANFLLVPRLENFEVPNVLTAGKVERTIGGYIVRLSEFTKVGAGRYGYTLEVLRGTHTVDEFSAFRVMLSHYSCAFYDADGGRLYGSASSTRSGPDSWTLTSQVLQEFGNGPKRGEPARLVWGVPVDMRSIKFPVEFKDLPVP